MAAKFFWKHWEHVASRKRVLCYVVSCLVADYANPPMHQCIDFNVFVDTYWEPSAATSWPFTPQWRRLSLNNAFVNAHLPYSKASETRPEYAQNIWNRSKTPSQWGIVSPWQTYGFFFVLNLNKGANRTKDSLEKMSMFSVTPVQNGMAQKKRSPGPVWTCFPPMSILALWAIPQSLTHLFRLFADGRIINKRPMETPSEKRVASFWMSLPASLIFQRKHRTRPLESAGDLHTRRFWQRYGILDANRGLPYGGVLGRHRSNTNERRVPPNSTRG